MTFYIKREGEYYFKSRPRIHLFSNISKLISGGYWHREWSEIYKISMEELEEAHHACCYDGELYEEFHEWLTAPEKEPEEF
jgi:hypothetical protein